MRHLLQIPLCLAVTSSLLAGGAQADSPMTAQEFDRYTLGKTFYYAENGAAYGGEEYLPNRRVRWAFKDEDCKDGYWYSQEGQICFVYEDGAAPQCWVFTQADAGLLAVYRDESGETELYEMKISQEPLFCPGPAVGM